MHRKIAVTFAAVLLLGSASAGLAQGTGRGGAPSPDRHGRAPTPASEPVDRRGPALGGLRTVAGYRNGRMDQFFNADPGMPSRNQSGSPSNITPTPGIGQPTSQNPSGTLTGGPTGDRAFERKVYERKASERRAGPQTSRTLKRTPNRNRKLSPTGHVPPTSDFRTGGRSAWGCPAIDCCGLFG